MIFSSLLPISFFHWKNATVLAKAGAASSDADSVWRSINVESDMKNNASSIDLLFSRLVKLLLIEERDLNISWQSGGNTYNQELCFHRS